MNKYPSLFSSAAFDCGMFDLCRYQDIDPVDDMAAVRVETEGNGDGGMVAGKDG